MIGRTSLVQGTMQRSMDGAQVKQHEDNQSTVNQMNANHTVQKEVQIKSETVIKKDDADFNQGSFDAKEEGKNKYYEDNKKKKKQDDNDDGVVTPKHIGSFDMKI